VDEKDHRGIVWNITGVSSGTPGYRLEHRGIVWNIAGVSSETLGYRLEHY
jgi:hypothetical protein